LKSAADDVIVGGMSAKRTRAGGPVFRRGPFKGKRVELAATTGIERFDEVAEEFMLNIFGFDAGEYLITDLSSLHDFVGVDEMEFVDILSRIRDVYGLDLADLPSGNLIEIFKRLDERRPTEGR
jgi:hypothetical protein